MFVQTVLESPLANLILCGHDMFCDVCLLGIRGGFFVYRKIGVV